MTGERQRDWGWPLLMVFFALVAAAFVVRVMLNAGTMPLIEDTDDAMRLVTVRDLLAGQGWFDNVQHRLNTPFGAEIHWSRLIDLPLAALLFLATQFVGAQYALTAAGTVWPLAGAVLGIIAAGVALGAVTGRYHYFVDVVLGVVLGVIANAV